MENSRNTELQGLTSKEAAKRLYVNGYNVISQGKKQNPAGMFASQFKDLMIMILLASTAVSVLMGEVTEAIVIVTIVLINAILGFVQEYRTERTLEALKGLSAPTATVIRDGQYQQVESSLVVPGDVLLLKAGDRVAADCRILLASSLLCDESLLSGESLAVEKHAHSGTGRPTGEQMLYMGTNITKGRGRALVTATGMSTEMGRIAGMLGDIKPDPTPLQEKLEQLGKYIAAGCLVICAIVSVTGILRGEPVLDMLLIGISLAVAAVPEGLPAIVTISLAIAIRRILKRNAIVKKLHSVETMGCSNVICSDKTGTLTENKMTVKQIYTTEHSIEVSGSGYEKAGDFKANGRIVNMGASKTLKRLLEISVLCNNAQLHSTRNHFASMRNRLVSAAGEAWEIFGEATEAALLVMAAKAYVMGEKLPYERVEELPFDSERKRMSVIVREPGGTRLMMTKGAPDLLLSCCSYYMTDSGVKPLTPQIKRDILRCNDQMAQKALRVLGFAYKSASAGAGDAEQNMVFVGLAGMIDPPRREAYDAVLKCKQARIRPIMITGDHKLTACAIAKDLKIMHADSLVLTGAEVDAMTDAQFEAALADTAVFARVSPAHKLKIVRTLKKQGNIVAMTGDGVNDAPAVKEANIGVSMGTSGTDVTKEAASVILLDDNFATLVAAIEEGRVIYQNIRKFIRYLLSCNIGEVVTMFVGMLMGLPIVLMPIQILLVNLATDGLPAIALGMEPAEEGVMSQRPRRADESIFAGGLISKIIFRGFLIGLTTLAVFVSFYKNSGHLETARTGALVTLVLTQLFHVFECKSEHSGLFGINIFSNPFLILSVLISAGVMSLVVYHPLLQIVFQTVALPWQQLLRIFAYSLAAPVGTQIFMAIFHRPKVRSRIQENKKSRSRRFREGIREN